MQNISLKLKDYVDVSKLKLNYLKSVNIHIFILFIFVVRLDWIVIGVQIIINPHIWYSYIIQPMNNVVLKTRLVHYLNIYKTFDKFLDYFMKARKGCKVELTTVNQTLAEGDMFQEYFLYHKHL